MATQMSQSDLDVTEQLARIRRMSAESDKLNEERLQFSREQFERQRRMAEESDKLHAERIKIMEETRIISFSTVFQGLIAVAALLGAGAAMGKLFFP